ncbi:MAG: methyltransferase domain-containing protein [Prolixibacteraceae bacterium]|nr:methyltransferase domain-containing protein [Prolixibacteraceae bacterium]
MQIRHSDRLLYFREQEITTGKHVLPFIERSGAVTPGMRILEVGCGEGGNLKPFLERGCRVTGVDLAENKINLARALYADIPGGEEVTLVCDDIYRMTPPAEKYDVVFMRDVIEHIHDQERFMVFIRRFMHEGSRFFLAFPPWQNPFGGHQQICRHRWLARLPWIHLLPASLYRVLLRAAGESPATVESLEEIRETRLTIERFEALYTRSGFCLAARALFLVNPNYEVKFGLRPRPQPALIAALPWIRNFLTTSVYYCLLPGKEPGL